MMFKLWEECEEDNRKLSEDIISMKQQLEKVNRQLEIVGQVWLTFENANLQIKQSI